MLLKGSRKYWMIAIICGLLAAGLAYRYLHYMKTCYQPDDLIQVVRARTDIARDSVITADQVEVINVPAKYSHPSAVKNKQEIVGKIAVSDISTGEEILQQKILSAKDREDRLAYSVPVNKRAVSIPINEISGVAGHVKVGDRVDIIATLDIPGGDSGGGDMTYTILTLQDIEVLAVGASTSGDAKKTEANNTMTLAVSVSEAQPLVLASERGNIRLLLRSPVDEARNELLPMKLRDFISQ